MSQFSPAVCIMSCKVLGEGNRIANRNAAPIAYAFTPIIVIAAGVFWTKFTGGLEATSTFATLGFVSMVVDPMLTLLTSWPQIGSCLACVSRIESFLQQEEREDKRALPREAGEAPLADARVNNEGSEKQPLDRFPVQFLNTSIAPSDSQEAVVHVNGAIEASTLTMVVGPTGCGKSTLLKGVIGEANILQGSVLVSRKDISYCDEHVWIRNITIRENIVGENAFDEVLYKRVIHACMLADMDEFPKGDLTLAGSGGLTLSGGQKQRIVSVFCVPKNVVQALTIAGTGKGPLQLLRRYSDGRYAERRRSVVRGCDYG